MQKKSTLKLDITGFVKYKLHNGYRLNLLNIEENIAQNKEIKKLRGFQHVIYKIFKLCIRTTYYKERERTVYDSEVFTYQEIYLDGYWQNEKYSLNKAISIANGRFIARMDADDISFPDRIKKQVEFLEDNLNVDVVGGQAFNIGGGYENSSSLLELFHFLEQELDIKMTYKQLPARESDQRVFVADITKVKDLIGWQPQVGKAEGIRKMIEWVSAS